MPTLFEMREYSVGDLQEALTRLLPESLLEKESASAMPPIPNPRRAVLKVVDKVVGKRIRGEHFADVLAWAVDFLLLDARTAISVATLVAGISGSLFDYMGVGDQAEIEANYSLDSGEEEQYGYDG